MTHRYVEELKQGKQLALSRALTLVEAGQSEGRALLDEIFPHTGHAYKIGITGPPGAGKSTLVNALARQLRALPAAPTLAILAVDPTSPFTGGAVLGDRVRMQDLAGDPGVFIRSMATRGALGGLASTTEALTQVFDAAGYTYILIETVGAGQSEVEIASLAHTTIVIEAPGAGDEIQSIKAGILEIADILVVNKADHPGADQSVRYLESMLNLGYEDGSGLSAKHSLKEGFIAQAAQVSPSPTEGWRPPVLKTVATQSIGIAELISSIQAHAAYMEQSGLRKAHEQAILARSFSNLLRQTVFERWVDEIPAGIIAECLDGLTQRNLSPQAAVEKLLAYNHCEKKNQSLE